MTLITFHGAVAQQPMARYMITHIGRLLQAPRKLSTAQRIGAKVLESVGSRAGRNLQALNQHNQCIHCQNHKVFPQARSMETMSDASPVSTWNNWLPETQELFLRLKAMTERESGWILVRNTNTDPPPTSKRYLFSRVSTTNGPVIHYSLFVQKEAMKLCGVCQFGEEAQGPVGYTHGGASATIHDVNTGVLSQHSVSDFSVTASLTVNYKKPTPLRAAILLEANIDRIEGNKVYLKSYLKSPDGATVYSECSALFINLEGKIRKLNAAKTSPTL